MQWLKRKFDTLLQKVSAPVTIFWAENDVLCDPKVCIRPESHWTVITIILANTISCVPQGVKRLEKELPNLEGSYRINDTQFTHIDYLFAKDADKLVYKTILDILQHKGNEIENTAR